MAEVRVLVGVRGCRVGEVANFPAEEVEGLVARGVVERIDPEPKKSSPKISRGSDKQSRPGRRASRHRVK